MNNLFPKAPGRSWPMSLGDVYAHLGLGCTKNYKLPTEAIPVHLIQGVPVWVEAKGAKQPVSYRGRPHRVMAACPECGFICSLGRMHQHAKIHAPKATNYVELGATRPADYTF